MITKTVLGPIESWIRYIRKIRALSSRKYRMTKLKKKKNSYWVVLFSTSTANWLDRYTAKSSDIKSDDFFLHPI